MDHQSLCVTSWRVASQQTGRIKQVFRPPVSCAENLMVSYLLAGRREFSFGYSSSLFTVGVFSGFTLFSDCLLFLRIFS
jgi:hypothetical protein